MRPQRQAENPAAVKEQRPALRWLQFYADRSPWLAERFMRAHVVQLPFNLLAHPSDDPHDLLAFVPRRMVNEAEAIDLSLVRLSYPSVLFVGRDPRRSDVLLCISEAKERASLIAMKEMFYPSEWAVIEQVITLFTLEVSSTPNCPDVPMLSRIIYLGATPNGEYVSSMVDINLHDEPTSKNTEAAIKQLHVAWNQFLFGAWANRRNLDMAQGLMTGWARNVAGDALDTATFLRLWREQTDGHMTVFAAATALLNTKNVVQEKVAPLSTRAERRRGERPPYSYHVLKVRPFGARRADGARELIEDGRLLPIHWVRGHFKTYTAERPLMGRFTGRYWFQPHLAGRDKVRFVDKDYKVEHAGR